MADEKKNGSEQELPDDIEARARPVRVRNALLGYRLETDQQKKWRPYNRPMHQLRELETLIRHRHGAVIPETDDAVIYGEVAAIMLFVINPETIEKTFPAWCKRWMPWANQQFVDQLLIDLRPYHQMPSDDALAHMLRLSYAERCELGIRCLGSHDVTKRQRAKIQASKRREQDRARKRRMRRATGAKPRSEYQATSLSNRSPWRDEGVSRRTWYRRQTRYR